MAADIAMRTAMYGSPNGPTSRLVSETVTRPLPPMSVTYLALDTGNEFCASGNTPEPRGHEYHGRRAGPGRGAAHHHGGTDVRVHQPECGQVACRPHQAQDNESGSPWD